MQCKRTAISSFVAVVMLASVAARASEVSFEQASKTADEIDAELVKLRTETDAVSSAYGTSDTAGVSKVDRRLREAEIHALLGDHLRAAIVLFDVAEDEVSRSHPRYEDCIVLLAESLRKSGSPSSAKRYYEELLSSGTPERIDDIVLGLLEIAGETNSLEDVDRYFALLKQSGSMSRPDLDYIYGKMLFRGAGNDFSTLDRARQSFEAVPVGHAISGQASYYAGVSLVRMGRYQEAIERFSETLRRAGSSRDGKHLSELAHLSIGRLRQELGDVVGSADAYQEIPQSSPYFSDMLYEVAWTHVRAANAATDDEARARSYTMALRATELLMATESDSRLFPDARILQGNLQIRLGAQETAYDTFQTIVDEYGAARVKLGDLVRDNADPKVFFDQLVAEDLERVGTTSLVPPVAATMALEEPEMGRAIGMTRTLEQSQEDLRESRDLVLVLDEALRGEARYRMFPGLGAARSKTQSIQARLMNLQRRSVGLERRLLEPSMLASERSALDAVRARAKETEDQISRLPSDEEAIDRSRKDLVEAYKGVGLRAFRQSYRVSGMRAQLVAVETWFSSQRPQMTPAEVALTEERLLTARKEVEALEDEFADLSREISRAQALAGSEGAAGRIARLKQEYRELSSRELAILGGFRSKAAPELQGILGRLDQQRAAMAQLEGQVEAAERSLDDQVNDKLIEVREALAKEAARLSDHTQEHGELTAQSDEIVGPVAADALGAVQRQFDELVLKADVGIIDVAWARKQDKTKKLNDLIKEQQERVGELEREFADVLSED